MSSLKRKATSLWRDGLCVLLPSSWSTEAHLKGLDGIDKSIRLRTVERDREDRRIVPFAISV